MAASSGARLQRKAARTAVSVASAHSFRRCYGSDFVARDTSRLFAFLDIEADLSDAYSPEQKGHVERVIRTFQHAVGPLLPGYIGHSVADRKSIENRKSFARRMGETDAETFAVSLSCAELQTHIDNWIERVYQHRPHAGLKDQTPFAVAAASSRAIRTVDERALDLLLMPVAGSDGQRIVTKFGIRIDGHHYHVPSIMPGTAVFVRQDPGDLGRAYAFAQDGGAFLAVATCPELAGIHPQTFVTAQREIQSELLAERTRQIKADMRRIAKGPALIERALDVAARDVPNVIALPKREVAHTTPQISAAIDALSVPAQLVPPADPRVVDRQKRLIEENALALRTQAAVERRLAEVEQARLAHLPLCEKIIALPETPKERYRRALSIKLAIDGGAPVVATDAVWLGSYLSSAEWRAQQGIHEDFGDAYMS